MIGLGANYLSWARYHAREHGTIDMDTHPGGTPIRCSCGETYQATDSYTVLALDDPDATTPR